MFCCDLPVLSRSTKVRLFGEVALQITCYGPRDVSRCSFALRRIRTGLGVEISHVYVNEHFKWVYFCVQNKQVLVKFEKGDRMRTMEYVI